MVSSGELTLCLDARILSEYAEVLLRPKFGFREDSVAALLHFARYRGHTVASSPLPEHLPDLSDEPFLEVALACGAECRVTGNLAHFPPRSRQGAVVVSPGEFTDAYRAL